MCSNQIDLRLTLADPFCGSDLPERPSPTSMRLVCIQGVWTAAADPALDDVARGRAICNRFRS